MRRSTVTVQDGRPFSLPRCPPVALSDRTRYEMEWGVRGVKKGSCCFMFVLSLSLFNGRTSMAPDTTGAPGGPNP